MLVGAFFTDHWGDIASVAGLLLAIGGFGATIWQVRKSRKASEAAAAAVADLRRELIIFDLATEMARAKSIMEEIKRLQRAGAWHVLPDRYQSLCECLIQIRNSGAVTVEEHRSQIATVIKHIRTIEERVEKSINTKIQSPSVTNLNTIIAEQHETLTEIFLSIKASLG